MKPRLAAWPLTSDDDLINWWGPAIVRPLGDRRVTSHLWAALDPMNTASDRRDADLMYRAVSWRWIEGIRGFGGGGLIRPERFAHWNSDASELIECGGEITDSVTC